MMSELFDVELTHYVKIKNLGVIEEQFRCLERVGLTFYNDFWGTPHLYEGVDEACAEINLSDRALNHLSTHKSDRRSFQSALDTLLLKLSSANVDSNLFQWKLKIKISSRQLLILINEDSADSLMDTLTSLNLPKIGARQNEPELKLAYCSREREFSPLRS